MSVNLGISILDPVSPNYLSIRLSLCLGKGISPLEPSGASPSGAEIEGLGLDLNLPTGSFCHTGLSMGDQQGAPASRRCALPPAPALESRGDPNRCSVSVLTPRTAATTLPPPRSAGHHPKQQQVPRPVQDYFCLPLDQQRHVLCWY